MQGTARCSVARGSLQAWSNQGRELRVSLASCHCTATGLQPVLRTARRVGRPALQPASLSPALLSFCCGGFLAARDLAGRRDCTLSYLVPNSILAEPVRGPTVPCLQEWPEEHSSLCAWHCQLCPDGQHAATTISQVRIPIFARLPARRKSPDSQQGLQATVPRYHASTASSGSRASSPSMRPVDCLCRSHRRR